VRRGVHAFVLPFYSLTRFFFSRARSARPCQSGDRFHVLGILFRVFFYYRRLLQAPPSAKRPFFPRSWRRRNDLPCFFTPPAPWFSYLFFFLSLFVKHLLLCLSFSSESAPIPIPGLSPFWPRSYRRSGPTSKVAIPYYEEFAFSFVIRTVAGLMIQMMLLRFLL